jgi:hypothetical protein
LLISAGSTVTTSALRADDQTVEATLRIPPGGTYVRVEVRGQERTYPAAPIPGLARELDMECLTNPIWLIVGDPPAGYRPEHAPPPARTGPRRTTAKPAGPA